MPYKPYRITQGPFHARTVVEALSVELDVRSAIKKHARFREAYEALTWLLARKCEEMVELGAMRLDDEHYLYSQNSDPIAQTPNIAVLYTFDDETVTIVGIHVASDED